MSLRDHAYEMVMYSNFHEIGDKSVFLTLFIISFAYLRYSTGTRCRKITQGETRLSFGVSCGLLTCKKNRQILGWTSRRNPQKSTKTIKGNIISFSVRKLGYQKTAGLVSGSWIKPAWFQSRNQKVIDKLLARGKPSFAII